MKALSPFVLFLVLFLSGVSFASAHRVYIESAYYGSGGRYVDVTRQVQRFARSDRDFLVSNDTFRVDPYPGHHKRLAVVYYIHGRRITANVPEGEMFYFRHEGVFDYHDDHQRGEEGWSHGVWD